MTTPTNGTGSGQRGYAMIIALLALALVTLTAAWNLRRIGVLGASVEIRAEGYRDHHERLGVRDIASVWLSRLGREGLGPEELLEIAGDGARDFEILLDEGVVLELWITDAQSKYLANLSLAEDEAHFDEMLRVLERLPEDRPDLVRLFGPPALSIRNADDLVIEAIAGRSAEVASALRSIRDREDADGRFANAFNEAGIGADQLPPTAGRLTYRPTLWAIDGLVTETAPSPSGASSTEPRRYRVLIELSGSVPVVHEARRLTAEEFELARGIVQ